MRFHSLFLAIVLLTSTSFAADEWPQFRGPDGQGHSDAEGIPTEWSETKNVAWKTPVPGEGWSSPVIWGNQVWMTSSTDAGKSLHAVCIQRSSGRLLFDKEVLTADDPGRHHKQNGYASPTPVLDGERVYVHFGPRGTAALDTQGNVVWRNTELEYNALQGAGSSPILHGARLILTCDGIDNQFLVALNKHTGKIIWKQNRAHLEAAAKKRDIAKMAYSTPLVVNIDGIPQLVSTGADHVAAYNVETGKEIWWMPYDGFSLVCRPSYGNGLLYVVGSVKLDDHTVYAIRPGGTGHLQKEQLIWQRTAGIPHVPSPLLVGKEMFVINADGAGVARCLDAMTGDEIWRARLDGNYRASPIEIRGRIYFSNDKGQTFVVAADKEYKLLATNELDGFFYASPAVAGRALFLRSETHLYRIES